MSDTLKHAVEAYDRRFQDLRSVVDALKYAKDNALDVEWLESFLYSYVQDQDAISAIHYANREWDL